MAEQTNWYRGFKMLNAPQPSIGETAGTTGYMMFYCLNEVKYINESISTNKWLSAPLVWLTENGGSRFNGNYKNGNNPCQTEQIKILKLWMYSAELDEIHISDTGIGCYYGGYYWRLFEFATWSSLAVGALDKDDTSQLLRVKGDLMNYQTVQT